MILDRLGHREIETDRWTERVRERDREREIKRDKQRHRVKEDELERKQRNSYTQLEKE